MAEIATYMCASNKCRFIVRLSRDFPVYHPHTPRHLRALSVTPAARGYVTSFRSDTYCPSCKKVLNDDGTRACRTCGSHLRGDLSMLPCPQCKKAPVHMPHLIVR